MSEEYTARLYEEIGSILTSGEKILAVSTQNAINSPIRRDSAIVTNRRIIHYSPKMLGRMEMVDMLWQDVVNLKLATKMLGAVISVEGNGRHCVIDGLEKASARRLYTVAQEIEEQWREKNRIRRMEEERARAGGVYFSGGTTPGLTPGLSGTAAPASIEERLEKLKSLHAKGLISDAEYESRKTQIIAEL